jgi:hypothetical protein
MLASTLERARDQIYMVFELVEDEAVVCVKSADQRIVNPDFPRRR